MTRGEIAALVVAWSHRTDLGDQVNQFIDTVTERLQRRLGITLDPMINDVNTNLVADKNGSIYLFGCLREMAIYTADAPAEREYDMLYEKEVNNMNINYNGDEWDNTTPYMRTEAEQEIEDAS